MTVTVERLKSSTRISVGGRTVSTRSPRRYVVVAVHRDGSYDPFVLLRTDNPTTARTRRQRYGYGSTCAVAVDTHTGESI